MQVCMVRRPAFVALDDAVPVLDHVLELVSIMFHETLHGPRGSVAEGADRVAFDLVRDIDEHVEILLATFAGEDPAE